jgi:hypothetical protein
MTTLDLVDLVWTDIALDRSSTARDVMCFVVPERIDAALIAVARYLAEQDPTDDTASERLLRVVIDEAIMGYLS